MRQRQAISTRMPAVAVEYDSRDKRVTKQFASATQARRFYLIKDREGRNPKVRRSTDDN